MTEDEVSPEEPALLEDKSLPDEGEWRIARKYIQRLGEPSALFTNCCRSLIQCSQSGNGKLSKLAASQLSGLLKSPSMLAQIFYAAKTYYLKEVRSRGAIEPADFTFFMQPYELASIITVGYSTRRIAHLLNKQDWDLIWEPYQRYADLAMPLGFAIPAIGPNRALLAGTGKFLGWGLFNLVDPENFKKYRVTNKVTNRAYCLKQETEKFGTTHLHIASLIWQRFGFGVELSEEYFSGLSDSLTNELTANAIKFKVARVWLESLLERGAPPTQELGDDFELEVSAEEKFIETFNSIKANGSEYKWLLRTRDDIGVEITPDLIADFEAMKKVLKKKGRGGLDILEPEEEN